MQYINHCSHAPKRLLNELLTEAGYPDCDSALTPHNMIRTEEMYYEPFRTGKVNLTWEAFNYTDVQFLSTDKQSEEEEKVAKGCMMFLKCWS